MWLFCPEYCIQWDNTPSSLLLGEGRLIPSLAFLYMLSSWLPQAQTNGTKGLEERDGETKSLEGGAVKFPDLDSALTDRRRQDGENLRFPTLVKNKKRRSRLPMCRRCRI